MIATESRIDEDDGLAALLVVAGGAAALIAGWAVWALLWWVSDQPPVFVDRVVAVVLLVAGVGCIFGGLVGAARAGVRRRRIPWRQADQALDVEVMGGRQDSRRRFCRACQRAHALQWWHRQRASMGRHRIGVHR